MYMCIYIYIYIYVCICKQSAEGGDPPRPLEAAEAADRGAGAASGATADAWAFSEELPPLQLPPDFRIMRRRARASLTQAARVGQDLAFLQEVREQLAAAAAAGDARRLRGRLLCALSFGLGRESQDIPESMPTSVPTPSNASV